MEKEAAALAGRDWVAANDKELAGLKHSRFAVRPANRCRVAIVKEVCLLLL